jgi:hypothetical protein
MDADFQALTILDVFMRESLAIEAEQKPQGEDAVATLNDSPQKCGVPKFLFRDNCSELPVRFRANHNRVQIDLPISEKTDRQRTHEVIQRHAMSRDLDGRDNSETEAEHKELLPNHVFLSDQVSVRC